MSKGLVNSTGWLVVFFLSCSQGVTPREELVSAREEALLKTPESATTRFDRWLARYLAADAATRVALEAQGAQLAEQRKSEFIELIHASPRQAFDSAVQPQVRAQLPASVNRWVERFVDSRGDSMVWGGVSESGPVPWLRTVTFASEAGQYQVFTWGRRASQTSVENARLHAVVIDDLAVLSDSPMRRLFVGEAPPANLPKVNTQCPTSKREISPTQVFNTVDAIEGFCMPDHATAREIQLFDAEGHLLSPTAWTTGNKTLLFIRVDFSDKPGDPATSADVTTLMQNVSQFMQNESFGQLSITTTVTPTFRVAMPSTSYTGLSLQAEARTLAAAAGFDTANYDLDTVGFTRLTTGDFASFLGRGALGAKGTLINGIPAPNLPGVCSHELGHNLSARHANLWNTQPPNGTGQPWGQGTVTEYADPFDTMGNSCSNIACHYNMYFRAGFGWTNGTEVQSVSSSGTYRLITVDAPVTTGLHALRISRNDGDADYWLEFRATQSAATTLLSNGVLLTRNPITWGDARGVMMTDANPQTKAYADAPIAIGRTFSDTTAGIHITPLAKVMVGTAQAVDVVVNFGTPATNHAPTISLTASTTTPGISTPVTYTATASDVDGDTLTYYWELSPGNLDVNYYGTQSSITKTYNTTTYAKARCTVSDMKGGSATAEVVVKVGATSYFTLSGTVTSGGQPLPDVIITDGITATTTNTDGTWTLIRYSAGSVTVTALKSDYAFTSNFSSPLTVSASQMNLNFTGTPVGGYSVSGYIIDQYGNHISGVSVSDGSRTVTSDSNGHFAITGVPSGRYTYTVTKPGWQFRKINGSSTIDVTGADVTVSFEAWGATLSGILTSASGLTTVTDGFRNVTATPAGAGVYSYNLYTVPPGQYSVTATSPSATYTPNFTNPVTVAATNISNLNFTGAAGTSFSISGTARSGGAPLAGVTVTTGTKTATTNAAGTYTLTGFTAGTYTLTATKSGFTFNPATRSATVASANVTGIDFTTTVVNAAPTIATPAAASMTTTTGTSVTLSVLGADDQGESNLTYTWATPTTPAPTFSANGTNGAKASTVTFTAPGTYVLTVTVRDGGGLTVTSQVSVTVTGVLTSLKVLPTGAFIGPSAMQVFTASGLNQFGGTMTLGSTAWAVSGGGTISSTGTFTANATPGGPFTVTATSGGKTGTASVTILPPGAPTITTAASANPSPVVAKTTQVSVTASDTGGEPALTYTWSLSSGPDAVTFAPNGTNAAKSALATFTKAGTYVLTVTVTDTDGLSVTSDVTVVVQQKPTRIEIVPATTTVAVGQHVQFSATVIDQFDDATDPPQSVTWSVPAGQGTITASGDYVSTMAGGPWVITAVRTSAIALATVRVVAGMVDAEAPQVEVSSPAPGTVIDGMADVAAVATDNIGVTSVDFFIDDAPVATANAQPWVSSIDTGTLSDGKHTLLAKAKDAAGNVGTSAPVTVYVRVGPSADAEAPMVKITSPAANAKVAGAVAVAIEASDDVGVTQVELLVDDVSTQTFSTAPYTASLMLPKGEHTLIAIASDASGKATRSEPVSFTVTQGCGCQSQSGWHAGLWALVAWVLMRRRR